MAQLSDTRSRPEAAPSLRLPPNAEIVPRGGERKMSEILVEFAQPMLDHLDESQYREGISAATLAWNAAMLSGDEGMRTLEQQAKKIFRFDPLARQGMVETMRSLIERKKQHFAHIKRIIMDYQVIDLDDGYRVNVISSEVPEGKG